MGDSSFDCYLCGTANPASADYCVKCSGQLLKIGDSGADAGSSEPSSDLPDSFENPFATGESATGVASAAPQMPSRKIHASIEDQRLSDALGLTDLGDEAPAQPQPQTASTPGQPPQQAQTPGVPSAQPTGQPSRPAATAVAPPLNVANIDGDPRGSIFTSRGDEEVGPIAWVIVAMLFMAVGWFGYSTLVRTPDRPTPESIGFVAETTTVPPTTTTAPEQDLATAQEVDRAYNSSLVRLVPFQCEAGNGDQNGEPLVGVAINRHNVLVGPGLPAGTNAIRIVTRTGATRVAILNQQAGVTIATSNAQTSRNLEIEEIGTETAFYMHYDLEENDVFVSRSSPDESVEIEVSETGAIHRIRAGGTTVGAEQLAAIDQQVVVDEDRVVRGNSTCNQTAGLVFDTPVAEQAATEDENE